MGPNAKRLISLEEEGISTQTHTQREDQSPAERKRLPASQGERPQKKPTLLDRLILDFQPPGVRNENAGFFFFSATSPRK